MINAEAIGNSIRILRKQKHLSQEQLAEELGLYQADISNLERAAKGSGIMDLFRLDLIADYFGIPLPDLLNGLPAQQGYAPAVKVKNETDPQVPVPGDLPVAEEGDLLMPDYSDLSVVYRYRLMVETSLKYPSAELDIDDIPKLERAILKKLKAACRSEEAYKVWKKDLTDARIREVSEKDHLIVCTYMFIGAGEYTEVIREEELPSFKAWIGANGSALMGSVRPANKRDIRRYAAQHIADDLLGIE